MCSVKNVVHINFATFTGKHILPEFQWPATLLKKRLWHRCFAVNFANFLRTPSLHNTSDDCFLNSWVMSVLTNIVFYSLYFLLLSKSGVTLTTRTLTASCSVITQSQYLLEYLLIFFSFVLGLCITFHINKISKVFVGISQRFTQLFDNIID